MRKSRSYGVVWNIAVHHADDGYYRREHFCGLLIRSMSLMHLADGTNVCGSRGGEFEGRVGVGA